VTNGERVAAASGTPVPASLSVWWRATTSRCERAMVALLLAIAGVTIFSTALVQTLVVALTVVTVSCFVVDRRTPWSPTPLDLPFLAFLGGRVLSIAFSQHLRESLSALWVEFFFYGVFFLTTQAVRREKESAVTVLLGVMVAAAVGASLFGIVDVALDFERRATSTTAGPYTLGAYLCLVLPLTFMFTAGTRRSFLTPARWLIPLVLSAGIILTFDRLHWAAMALILGVVFLRPGTRLPIILIGVAVVCFLALPSVRGRLLQIAALGQYMDGRDVLWRGAAMIAWTHPLVGFGPRTFPDIFPLFLDMPVRGVGSWHNDYLQVYMESGLLGLLPLGWLVVATYVHGIRWLRFRAGSPSRRTLVRFLLGSVTVMFLIGGMLDTVVGISFRILLGLLACLIVPSSPVTSLDSDADNSARAARREPAGL
jgi:O-antigen ligase